MSGLEDFTWHHVWPCTYDETAASFCCCSFILFWHIIWYILINTMHSLVRQDHIIAQGSHLLMVRWNVSVNVESHSEHCMAISTEQLLEMMFTDSGSVNWLCSNSRRLQDHIRQVITWKEKKIEIYNFNGKLYSDWQPRWNLHN